MEVVGLKNAVRVEAGSDFTCALLNDQTLTCWGQGGLGQLGNGGPWHRGTATFPVPQAFPGAERVVEFEAGPSVTCYETATEGLWCVGDQSRGQVGNGNGTQFGVPTLVPL